jgi:phosphoribosyl 1,2-cyclic phosphodiesterase
MLDLGTGARFFGLDQPDDGSFDGVCLLTHLHWDHVQGLPFFTPILAEGGRLEVFGPRPESGLSLVDAVCAFMQPPYFPVELSALPGSITWTEAPAEPIAIDDLSVLALPVPHTGPTLGFRVTHGDNSVAYVSDHQQPCDITSVDDGVLRLANHADVLIHDAQYTPDEFSKKSDWGHCTVEYAVEVAAQAQVHTLVLFHHDPTHDDDTVDELLAHAKALGELRGVPEVVAASEGMRLSLP